MEGYIYTVRDVADILKVSTKTVYRLVQDGALPCIWVYGSIRIPQSALDTYLRQCMSD